MSQKRVEIYTTMFCPFCFRAKQLLKEKGIAYEEIAVDMDRGKRAEMRERAGGSNTVPQIFVGDVHVGGCDDLFAMDRAGKFDPLLESAA